MAMEMMDKKTLRAKFRAIRAAITPSEMEKEAITAAAFLSSFLKRNQAIKTVAAYMPIGNELSTAPAMDVCYSNKCQLCLPAWDTETQAYRFMLYPKGAELEEGPMGVLQPKDGPPLEPSQIDLFLVPGLAFDSHGGRLGYGGGWYDRLLSQARPDAIIVGFCHHKQLSSTALPVEEHDIKAMPWQLVLK